MEVWLQLLLALMTVAFPPGAGSLRLLDVAVPSYTLRGERATLRCAFDLQDDLLYSVTWYKDHEEFYRFVPRASPPQTRHALDGLCVHPEESDSQQVSLVVTSLRASGVYRCEVSAEAPSFTSVHGEGRMDVVALPSEGPHISGHVVDDDISLNCSSGKSFPPATLRWFINGRQVIADFVLRRRMRGGLTTTVSGLVLQQQQQQRLHVVCVASISGPLHDSREATFLLTGSSSAVPETSWRLLAVLFFVFSRLLTS